MTSWGSTKGSQGSGNVPHPRPTAFTQECAEDGRTGSKIKGVERNEARLLPRGAGTLEQGHDFLRSSVVGTAALSPALYQVERGLAGVVFQIGASAVFDQIAHD